MTARISLRPRWVRALLVPVLLVSAGLAPALAKTYSAERFDVDVRVLSGGAIEVTETIVFRFESGTFERVFREIPRRRIDDIEIVAATMDGVPEPFANGGGRVEISRRNGMRVEWRFAPISPSTHTFVLTYIARGVISRERDGDLLAWRALPSQHDYRIDSSTIRIEHAAAPAGTPTLETNRVDHASVEPLARAVVVSAAGIRRNGTVVVRVPFAAGSVISEPPAWQARELRVSALAPRWIAAAGGVLIAGLILLFAQRQGYSAPPSDADSHRVVHDPPGTLPPALAGALVSNGRPGFEHAMAALFGLAHEAEIAIAEEPRRVLGQRRFTLRRLGTGRALSAVDDAVLGVIFADENRTGSTVSLSKARSRLTRRFSQIKRAITSELASRGLLDEDRRRVRSRYGKLALTLLLLGAAGLVVAGILAQTFGPWTLLVPGALVVVGVIGFIVQGAMTPLSDQAVRLAAEWRAFRQHLKEVTKDKVRTGPDASSRLLALAVALGLGSAWAKYMKKHPATVPSWFHAVSAGSDDGGFTAFVAATAATSGHGGGVAGAGGAAGGGASGAS